MSRQRCSFCLCSTRCSSTTRRRRKRSAKLGLPPIRLASTDMPIRLRRSSGTMTITTTAPKKTRIIDFGRGRLFPGVALTGTQPWMIDSEDQDLGHKSTDSRRDFGCSGPGRIRAALSDRQRRTVRERTAHRAQSAGPSRQARPARGSCTGIAGMCFSLAAWPAVRLRPGADVPRSGLGHPAGRQAVLAQVRNPASTFCIRTHRS